MATQQHTKEHMQQFGTQNFQIRWCTSAEVLLPGSSKIHMFLILHYRLESIIFLLRHFSSTEYLF